ncbi:hypothetical protein JMJ77_0010682 [Colletotrichum scovillei]|uniref:Uncharacterized protein n=1 Tax=Colletotrichum scovillei TaxID=1209932 RepID=A0A9P7R2C7_9PEZI|nr:hypothetical protein JMJ77_0010682 [Colletotrichum scovillei]KAG7059648.1 hypothetical protein JMJ78_0014937 [Colletotrichum scovillei]KAG7067096.1 hypothetical protein JMJ76_0008539 [Colletotrichum scovillei]
MKHMLDPNLQSRPASANSGLLHTGRTGPHGENGGFVEDPQTDAL